jgi:hypothetical protein
MLCRVLLIFMLSIVMLSVILLNIVAPFQLHRDNIVYINKMVQLTKKSDYIYSPKRFMRSTPGLFLVYKNVMTHRGLTAVVP